MVIHVTNMFFTHLLNDKNRKTCLCVSLLNVADLNTGFISPLCQYACTLHLKSQFLPTNLRCRQDKEHVTTAPTFSRRYTHTSWSRSLCSRSVGDRFSLKLMMLSYLCANFFWSLLSFVFCVVSASLFFFSFPFFTHHVFHFTLRPMRAAVALLYTPVFLWAVKRATAIPVFNNSEYTL